MSSPTLAAVTLDESGGGVAAVSRLIWRVMGETWTDRCRLITLGVGPVPDRPTTADRVKFGLRVGAEQLTRADGWMFFSHLALARTQAYLPAFARRPYVVFLHGIEAWRTLSSSDRDILRRAALRVANSRFTAAEVSAANPGVGPIEVCQLATWPESTPGAQALESSRVPAIGSQAVLLVGRMSSAERYKGHDALLDAWSGVLAAVPGARLVFAGDGDDRVRLAAKAMALGIGERVVFTGFLSMSGLADLYARSQVFAMPSRGEGFGLVYLEAMSHGLPCIGSIHDAAREIINDGETGYLIDQADPVALTARLTALLTDAPTRARLGAAGRHRVEEQFNYPRFAQRLVELVRGAVGVEHAGFAPAARSVD